MPTRVVTQARVSRRRQQQVSPALADSRSASSRSRSLSGSQTASSSTGSPSPVATERRSAAAATKSSSSRRVSFGARVRRPTPAAPRRNSNRLSDFIVRDRLGSDEEQEAEREEEEAVETVQVERSGQASAAERRAAAARDLGLTWYERLMPECLLGLTAPITGYESDAAAALRRARPRASQLELDLLERQRLSRNRRIRRRLVALLLVASLASAFFVYRGRASQPGGGLFGARRAPQGVRQVVGEMAHRFEDGLSRTIHDTMGK